MELLEGRVAIITGGSGALGRAAVEHFLIAGAQVAVPYIIDAEVPLVEQRLGNRFPSRPQGHRQAGPGYPGRARPIDTPG